MDRRRTGEKLAPPRPFLLVPLERGVALLGFFHLPHHIRVEFGEQVRDGRLVYARELERCPQTGDAAPVLVLRHHRDRLVAEE